MRLRGLIGRRGRGDKATRRQGDRAIDEIDGIEGIDWETRRGATRRQGDRATGRLMRLMGLRGLIGRRGEGRQGDRTTRRGAI
jgi:hypothetical protein